MARISHSYEVKVLRSVDQEEEEEGELGNYPVRRHILKVPFHGELIYVQ